MPAKISVTFKCFSLYQIGFTGRCIARNVSPIFSINGFYAA
jgi:hypothetical protein